MFSFPTSCGDVLLSHHKDEIYETEVKNLLREVTERIFGIRILSQLQPELSLLSKFTYYFLSLGIQQPQQTLGEEFCEILRAIHSNKFQAITISRHFTWLALFVLPQYIYSRSIVGWQNLAQISTSTRAYSQTIDNERYTRIPLILKRFLRTLDTISAWFQSIQLKIENTLGSEHGEQQVMKGISVWIMQWHLACFYLFQQYFHLSKRMTKIQYISLRLDRQVPLQLNALGLLLIIQLTGTAVKECRNVRKRLLQQQTQRIANRVPSQMHIVSTIPLFQQSKRNQCALCLNERQAPAVTPCGHVYCWECIVGWCQHQKPECPMCRQSTQPQEIQLLVNYT